MQHICQKLGIEMTCSAFADAFEAEIKLRHPKRYFGEGKRGKPMRLAVWGNDPYRRTSPLNFHFSDNGNAVIYRDGQWSLPSRWACGRTVTELADNSYLIS